MPRLVTTPEAKQFGVYLGRVMRQARKRAGMKAHAVAEDMNTTQQAVSHWETGNTLPQISNLFSYCQVVGYPVWRVLARAERAYAMGQTMAADRARLEEGEDDE